MDTKKKTNEPYNTAVRTALWRALHLEVDAKPHIIKDEIGLRLIAPGAGWRQRPDMDPDFTKRLRASVVARARFIEDLLLDQHKQGISQYVILGAGLDTFAQRRPDIASTMQVYEIDQPAIQAWKRSRLNEAGLGIQKSLHFVSVDFETSSWWSELLNAGFDSAKPAFVACTGVSLYLSKDAIISMLEQIAMLARGSTLAMTFYLPMDLLDEEDKFLQQIANKGAQEAGTPFISFFSPAQISGMATQAGLKQARTISTKQMIPLYFANRIDQLVPASGEVFLVASI